MRRCGKVLISGDGQERAPSGLMAGAFQPQWYPPIGAAVKGFSRMGFVPDSQAIRADPARTLRACLDLAIKKVESHRLTIPSENAGESTNPHLPAHLTVVSGLGWLASCFALDGHAVLAARNRRYCACRFVVRARPGGSSFVSAYDPSPGAVYLVGAGPGSPELITVRGLNLLRAADVVVYDALVHRDLIAAARPDAEFVFAGKRGYCVGSTLQETINDVLVNRARHGLAVVRLKGGDPCVFGRGGEEAEYLAERGIPFEIVPGVTTALGACAAASIPLTHRDAGQAVALVTGHFDPDSPECTLDWDGLARMSNIIVYMGLRHVEKIANRLMHAGMSPE